MNEEFDDELSKHIADVFEQYEDAAPAQEGWLMLRKKFPEKKKRRFAPLWWKIAAALLIITLFGLWLYRVPQQHKQITTKTKIRPTDTSLQKQPETAVDSLLTPLGHQVSNGLQYATVKRQKSAKRENRNPILDHKNNKPKNLLTAVDHPLLGTNVAATQSVIASVRVKTEANRPPPIALDHLATTSAAERVATASSYSLPYATTQKTDSAQINSSIIALARQPNKQLPKMAGAKGSDSVAVRKTSGLEALMASEQQKENIKAAAVNSTSANKKMLFNIYAATYFNYAEGSKSQFNTGAGVSTDIKLAGKFKLSAGVAIAKNTLNYNRQPTQSGLVSDAISASTIASDATASNSNLTNLGLVPLRVLTPPVVSAYNVTLTGLDIPVNIKYELNPKKTDSYITAGLSSGTFITESYHYSYDNSPNAFGASSNIPDATTRRSFSHFDFARTLNLAVGMGYQISKNNRLVIEPFLKYPLSGLGSQQIRFGAGGLNLRFKFQQAKK